MGSMLGQRAHLGLRALSLAYGLFPWPLGSFPGLLALRRACRLYPRPQALSGPAGSVLAHGLYSQTTSPPLGLRALLHYGLYSQPVDSTPRLWALYLAYRHCSRPTGSIPGLRALLQAYGLFSNAGTLFWPTSSFPCLRAFFWARGHYYRPTRAIPGWWALFSALRPSSVSSYSMEGPKFAKPLAEPLPCSLFCVVKVAQLLLLVSISIKLVI